MGLPKFSDCLPPQHRGGKSSHHPGVVTALPGVSRANTHKQRLGRENNLQQRWDPLTPRRWHWFWLQEYLAHPTQHGGKKPKHTSLGWLELKSPLPVWSRIICQTPAAVRSVLLGTLVIVLQPALRMWGVEAGRMIAALFMKIIWGVIYGRASTMHGVSVKQTQ